MYYVWFRHKSAHCPNYDTRDYDFGIDFIVQCPLKCFGMFGLCWLLGMHGLDLCWLLGIRAFEPCWLLGTHELDLCWLLGMHSLDLCADRT